MAGWDDGYVSDVVYTSNFHRETTPAWLATAALLLGHRPPDLAQPFTYADLGCGHGLTAAIVAATCPHAAVWGFDFNPAHIESARDLASRAGLTNLRFQETSFADLAALPEAALPAFDFMVSHGVMSWVSRENQQHLIAAIGQRLRPGGLAYLSYNVATGWGAMPPLRDLMRLLMLSNGGRPDQAANGVLDYLDTMKQAGAAFFAANPSLEQRLADIRRQDARYIAHEFLNRDWHPLMFADVVGRMTQSKCSYIGSATLVENIDLVSVPKGMTPLMSKTSDLVLRETLRDFATAQTFRRDIYRRGVLPLPSPEHARLADTLKLEWLGRAITDPISLSTPMGTLTGLPELYGPLLEILRAAPETVGEIRRHPALADRSLPDLLQAVTLLTSGSYVHPVLPAVVQTAARDGTARLNAAISTVNAYGGNIGQLASPMLGSAVPADLLETLIMQERSADPSMGIDKLVDRLLAILHRIGRSLQKDGNVVTDPIEARAVLRTSVQAMIEDRLPLLARLGAVHP